MARAALRASADANRAEGLRRFFKTGPGEYAEGDRFLGVTVPFTRSVARGFRDLSLKEIRSLLASPFHEDRLLALLILVDRYQRAASETERRNVFRFYMHNLGSVNNWDLVDLSAEHIVGPYVTASGSTVVDRLSRSPNVWKRRVSVLAHFHGIKQGRIRQFLSFAPRFFRDEHDLMHKAVGWMLREVGKRGDAHALEQFLDLRAPRMPRTMLRYAIEHFPEHRRRAFMAKT